MLKLYLTHETKKVTQLTVRIVIVSWLCGYASVIEL